MDNQDWLTNSVLPTQKCTSIFVVLMRSNTALSRMVRFFTGSEYTHAALALDRNLKYMFSFGRMWTRNPFVGCFRREDIREGVYASQKSLPGAIIEVGVTVEQYDTIRSLIGDFLLNSHRYDYNYVGLAKQIFGRTHFDERKFFCSEFVCYVLSICGAIDCPLPRGCVRPQDFLWIGKIVFQGNLHEYQRRVVSIGKLQAAESDITPSCSAIAPNVIAFPIFPKSNC